LRGALKWVAQFDVASCSLGSSARRRPRLTDDVVPDEKNPMASRKKKSAAASLPLGELPLSRRALGWLAWNKVERVAPPCSKEQTKKLLRERGAPAWPVLVAVETTFGGLLGQTSDDRELWFGACGGPCFGKVRKSQPLVCVAAYSPILWYVDEAGRVFEFDELGEPFYESDSIAHRIEQLAVHRTTGVCFTGRHGERSAKLLGLAEVGEARDSMTRAWGEPAQDHVKGVFVEECFTPSRYGARDRVWSTWIDAADAVVRKAETRLKLKRSSS
jgi:hypothetical protein